MKTIKNHIISRRFLYTMCFIVLFVIDWTRGSQAGAIWATTINLTGVVMAVILLSAYSPKEFFKPVYLIYSAVGIAALLAAYYWWNLHQAAIFVGQLLTVVLNLWLLGIFVIKMFLDVIVYRTRKIRVCMTEAIAALMLLWMLFSVNEDIWPGWYLLMFGLFYHTEYKREERDALKEGMLDGIITSFFLLQGAAYVFRPYDSVRYSGIYNNCNMNALFYGIVWVAFLIRLYNIRKTEAQKWKEILCFLFAGAMMAFALMTGCRTLLLAMIATGFFYVVFADFYLLKYRAGRFLRKLAIYAIVACITIPITFTAARYLPPIFHHPIWYDGEYTVSRVHSFDPWDSEKYVSWEDYFDMIAGRLKPIWNMIFGEKQEELSVVRAAEEAESSVAEERNRTVDSSIQVRIDFWKFYMQDGNLEGHLNDEGHELPDFPGRYIWHAQNTFVQFWYYYGVPSAILFVVVVVMLVIKSIKKILQGQDEALICLLYIVFWAMYGLAESVWYPGQMILFLTFFTPKFLWETEEHGEKTESTGELV